MTTTPAAQTAELLERIARCDECGRYVPDDELIYLREQDRIVCIECCGGEHHER